MSNSRPECEESHTKKYIIVFSNTWSKSSSRGRHLEEQNTLPVRGPRVAAGADT